MTKREEDLINKSSIQYPIRIRDGNYYPDESLQNIEYEIFYLDKGSVLFVIEDYEVKLTSGDVIFLQPETKHYMKKMPDQVPYHYYQLFFDSMVLGSEDDPCRRFFEGIRVSRYLNLIPELLFKIRNNSEHKNDFGHELTLKALLYDIVNYIVQTKQYVEISYPRQIYSSHSINAINSAIKYIHQHYKDQIMLKDLLELTSYSKSHFIRLFKKYVGLNFTDYINKYRIEKACLDLIYTQKNITEIGMENGFNTVQYFSTTFKYYMKCTPKQYQKNSRKIMSPTYDMTAN
ncbi:MAG: AraC family transcriptional regulator [Treponema sp.]|nr:AraC family transcriptional regulator [Treponema sp.]